MQLDRFPLCKMCQESGIITPANTVDHIIPHENDPILFWDTDNFQSLCPTHHSGVKRIIDTHGYSQACDKDGFPLDSGHPFNKVR